MTDLTPQQAAFVHEYVSNGGNGSDAARKAGYSEISAGKYAHELTRKKHVQEAIHLEQRRVLNGPLASLALTVLKGVLEDAKTAAGVRVDASKAVLDRGGHSPVKAADAPKSGERPLDEMTIAELEAFICEKEAALPPGGAPAAIARSRAPRLEVSAIAQPGERRTMTEGSGA